MNALEVKHYGDILGNPVFTSKDSILLCVPADGTNGTVNTQCLFDTCIDIFELSKVLDIYGRILDTNLKSVS